MPTKRAVVQRIGMAAARHRLPALAAQLLREPERLIEVTRRGKPVLHLTAPPRLPAHGSAARRILQRVAALDRRRTSGPTVDIARRYKRLLHGRPRGL